MSIDKRGERTWRFRVKYKRQLYTMTYEAPPTLTLKQAEKEANKQHDIFKADVIAGRVNLIKDITMNQLADMVYKEYVKVKLTYNTQQVYKQAYNNHILPALGNMDLKDIKPIHIQRFTNKLAAKVKASTVSNILACLSKTLSFAQKWEYIETNPCICIEKPKIERNNNAELLSLDEIEKLVNYYMNDEKDLMHKSAFCLAIGCGLRNSEIRALTTDDIDFGTGIINIDKQIGETLKDGVKVTGYISTKTPSSIRKIYAPKFVLDTLEQYIKSLPYIPINKQIYWSPATNNPITKHCLSKRFTSVIKGLGITQIRFHDLRHLQATILINSGANVKAVSKRMGHSKVDMTLNTYTSTIDSVDKKIAEQFNETFNNLKSLS